MQKDMALREHIAKEANCRDPCYALFCADILPILDLEYSRYEAEKAIESLLRSGRIEYKATADDWLFRPRTYRIEHV